MLSVSRNVSDTRFNELKQLLNVKAVESYDKYLRLPTVIEIDSMISRIFWSGDVSRRAKNWWRIYTHPETLLARVFKGVYFPRGSVWGARKGYHPSYAWTSILKTSWIFERGGLWPIGDGSKVQAWTDKWLPNGVPLTYRVDVAEALGIVRVSDMIEEGPKRWNREWVEEGFHPATTSHILGIPLDLHGGEDVLAWPHASDGQYTSKTGYNFICGLLALEAASSSSSMRLTLPPKLWRQFWSTDALPRCKEIVWRAIRGFLPVWAQLFLRHVDTDPGCVFCDHDSESTEHIFMRCSAAMAIWYASPLSLRVESVSSFQALWTSIIHEQQPEVVAMAQTMIYQIWEVRNRVLFRDGKLVVAEVIDRVLGMTRVALPRAREESTTSIAVWWRPQERVVKLNFDASFVDGNVAGLGMVARNHRGEIMASATSYPVPTLSALLAEACGLRWAMQSATELSFRRVCLETDCLQLFQWWQKAVVGRSYLDNIIRDCRTYVSFFDFFSLSFVRRTGNSVADFLAKNASTYANSVWVEEVSDAVIGLVNLDVLASPFGP
ncbi:uncharacterized protein LOC130737161 [Lotus japonicus]|uniref:uncharacterized protein LOC130737161 n=1 Tax=Lotus japonicus TaxID=34305 RepID=UPI0025858E9E|nr:uncharacterized protein LOC130737161 [Lotus japonicus]